MDEAKNFAERLARPVPGEDHIGNDKRTRIDEWIAWKGSLWESVDADAFFPMKSMPASSNVPRNASAASEIVASVRSACSLFWP
jgi:hypothetical protein